MVGLVPTTRKRGGHPERAAFLDPRDEPEDDEGGRSFSSPRSIPSWSDLFRPPGSEAATRKGRRFWILGTSPRMTKGGGASVRRAPFRHGRTCSDHPEARRPPGRGGVSGSSGRARG